MKAGCTRTVNNEKKDEVKLDIKKNIEEKEKKGVSNMILVGRKAPDFETQAYLKGKFIDVKLSNYLGKWVLLCFYPADFTFV